MKPECLSCRARVQWVAVAAVAVAHLVLLGLPGVNLEFTFSDAARYFSGGDAHYLDQYFYYEANTLTVPAVSALIARLLPWMNVEYIPRLLSVASIVLLASALMRLNARLGRNIPNSILVLAVLLNPIIWTFSGRGTADFLPVALALFALSLFWQEHLTWKRRLFASIVWGVAAVVKYHALVLIGVVVAEIALRHRGNVKKIVCESSAACLPAALLVALYVVWVKMTFGFWFTPPVFQVAHKLGVTGAAGNLVAYGGFLMLLTLPLSLFVPWRSIAYSRTKYWAVLFLAASFAVGYYGLPDNGEMNLGPLDPFISMRVLCGILTVLCLALVARMLLLLRAVREEPAFHAVLALILGMGAFLLVLSCTRPAQRYLLFIVPLMYFFLLPAGRQYRAVVLAAILATVGLDMFISASQYATGTAAAAITRQVEVHGLLAETDPGAVEPHTGSVYFSYRTHAKKFTIIAGDSDERMLSAHYDLCPGISRTYSLVPLP